MLKKQEILDYLIYLKPELQKMGIHKIGLFGSYAKDRADITSDIDITIESSREFVNKLGGMGAIIYLDELREKLIKHFKIQVDLCNTASMSEERKSKLLSGVIYV
ncbi:nucleotidyltransferase family protein [Campylobacter fetus]|uniref:nucleotidyltransferase family protein n=1 Tax=Campylobacter fetus TaxID=196 RepID=UPI000B2B1D2E|nr:nucleotidyltransferase domain-containing protein [Campylobacter fetus]